MEQEVKNVKYRGISRALSDMSISDGGCAESVNVSVRNGDMSVICPPEEVEQLPKGIKYDLIYIHRMFSNTEYIGKMDNGIGVVNGNPDASCFNKFFELDSDETLNDINSIGNVLIIFTDKRKIHLLYKNDEYKLLGDKLPEPKIDVFKLDVIYKGFTIEDVYCSVDDQSTLQDLQFKSEYILEYGKKMKDDEKNIYDREVGDNKVLNPYAYLVSNEKIDLSPSLEREKNTISTSFYDPYVQTAYIMRYSNQNALIKEAVEYMTKLIWDRVSIMYSDYNKIGVLTRPVFIRYALKMYNGNYCMLSSPILLGNMSGAPFEMQYINQAAKHAYIDDTSNLGYRYFPQDSDGRHYYPAQIEDKANLSYSSLGFILNNRFRVFADIHNSSELKNWEDIIQSLDFFISEPIDIIPSGTELAKRDHHMFYFKDITIEEKQKNILSKSNFYLIKSIPLEDLSDTRIDFTEQLSLYLGDLLATQPRLPEDNYREHHTYIPKTIFKYNNRLNLSSLKIDYYSGPGYMTSMKKAAELRDLLYEWVFTYHIKGENGSDILRRVSFKSPNTYSQTENEDAITIDGPATPGAWFTYPDPRCYKMEIDNKNIYGKYYHWEYTMKPHPALDCSYYLANPEKTVEEWYETMEEKENISDINEAFDSINNVIMQSESGNPFVFHASNIHVIPTTDIMGAATTSEPISQGQFGQYQLYIFTSDGIWAMQVQSDGTYMSAAPLSRDVCINPKSITGIEGAVIFITQRGVMILSSSQIRCISDDMIGRHFDISDLDRADMAIRNIAAREWQTDVPELVSDDMPFMDYMKDCFVAYDYGNRRLVFTNGASYYQYVYDLASGTWHKMCFSKKFKRTLNSYPECYLQEDGDTSDTVYDFSVISDTNAVTDRHFGLIITRAFDLGNPSALKRIDRILNMGDYEKGKVRCLLYGSNDYVRFVPVNSLKGSSYKSYRLVLFMDMLPSENVAMTTIGFTTRWDKRLR